MTVNTVSTLNDMFQFITCVKDRHRDELIWRCVRKAWRNLQKFLI
jgi:hypothetical protein